MINIRSVSCVCALALLTVGCGAPVGPSRVLVSSVVAARRDAAGIVRLDVEWRNVATSAVYLPGCAGQVSMSLERRQAAGWESFGGGICLANLNQSPIELAPHQAIRATVGVGPGEGGEYRGVTSVSENGGRDWEPVQSSSSRVN
jgi:hypothetical protein